MSLFDQVGGEQGMAAIVESFYERMLNDETLKRLFHNVDLSQLKVPNERFSPWVSVAPSGTAGGVCASLTPACVSRIPRTELPLSTWPRRSMRWVWQQR